MISKLERKLCETKLERRAMETWFERRITERNGRSQCVAESSVYGCMPFWFSDWHETAEAAEAEFYEPRGPRPNLNLGLKAQE
jgi:hypothetical protein